VSEQPGPSVPSRSAVEDVPSQTPLFWALEKDRYLRQSWIREIEEQTGRRLVAYVANFNHPQSAIGPDDIPPFPDLLHDIDPQTD